jgi:LCP family protein required for cell wall assembly
MRTTSASLLSAILPGAGQWAVGRRGVALVFAVPFLAGLLAVLLLARRGPAALALLVQPRWLWAIVFVNVVLVLARGLSVADVWRTAPPASPLARLAVVVLTVAMTLPHVLVHLRAVEAIDLLDTVFAGEAVAPLAQREAELLAAGVTPEQLGPDIAEPTEPAESGTPGEGAGDPAPFEPPDASPVPAPTWTTTTEPGPQLAPDDRAAEAYADLLEALERGEEQAVPDPVSAEQSGERITILLAGGDFGPGRYDLRTDVMVVATLEPAAGTAALISISRDLVDAPLPAAWSRSTTMLQVQDWHEGRAYEQIVEAAEAAGAEPPPRPAFVPCDCFADRINYLHVLTTTWVRTFPDAPDPGMEALRQTLEVLLGISIDHYVLVDFAGFVDLVDALGGINVRVTETMDVAFSPAKEDEDPVSVRVEPGLHHFDGRTALAYVRNRTGSSDLVRMQRQRCMLRDLAASVDPLVVLRRFPDIARAIRESTVTTVPLDLLPTLIETAASLDADRIATLAITPTRFTSSEPNYMGLYSVRADRVRAAVAELLQGVGEGEVGDYAATECG